MTSNAYARLSANSAGASTETEHASPDDALVLRRRVVWLALGHPVALTGSAGGRVPRDHAAIACGTLG